METPPDTGPLTPKPATRPPTPTHAGRKRGPGKVSNAKRERALRVARRAALVMFIGGFAILLVAVSIQQRYQEATQKQPGKHDAPGTDLPTPEPPPAEVLPDWTGAVTLRRAFLDEGKLVQRLPNGARVEFTVDPGLQQVVERLFTQYALPYAGAAILSVRTGRLLAFAGSSTVNRQLRPRDLVLRAWAPAASVFKLITTAALLERNQARALTKVCYHGGQRGLSAHHLVDDPKRDTTCHTLTDAVGMSLNAVIGKLALRRLERQQLVETANRFGFNTPLPFDLHFGSSTARIPRSDLGRAKVAAGFWGSTLSPLHGAMIAQALANEGLMLRPRLLDKVLLPGGVLHPRPPRWTRRVTTNFVARVVGRMMVLTTTVGTAKDGFYDKQGRAYLPEFKVAAKTGSLSRRAPAIDYNWLIGYAPYDRPEVAFGILIGNPPRWRTKSYYLARKILHAWFSSRARRAAERRARRRDRRRDRRRGGRRGRAR